MESVETIRSPVAKFGNQGNGGHMMRAQSEACLQRTGTKGLCYMALEVSLDAPHKRTDQWVFMHH